MLYVYNPLTVHPLKIYVLLNNEGGVIYEKTHFAVVACGGHVFGRL